MAKDHGSSVKDDKQYEGLRKKGMSKGRAAAIANTPDASSKGGKRSGSGGSSQSKRSSGRGSGTTSPDQMARAVLRTSWTRECARIRAIGPVSETAPITRSPLRMGDATHPRPRERRSGSGPTVSGSGPRSRRWSGRRRGSPPPCVGGR